MGEPRPTTRRTSGAPERLTVGLFSLAGFLAVLAVLGSQFGHGAAERGPRQILVRRVYYTTVVEQIKGGASRGSSTSTSESHSGSSSAVAGVVATRTS